MRIPRPARRLAIPLLTFAVAACSDEVPAPTDVLDPSAEIAAAKAKKNRHLSTAEAAPANTGSFRSLSAMKMPADPEVTAAFLAIGVAAVGDLVRQINGAYSQPCPLQTGIGYDGTNLIMSCWYHNTLDVLSPADGSLVKTLTVPGASGFGAMGWDVGGNRLWICARPTGSSLWSSVFVIDTSDPDGDGQVAPGEVEERFLGSFANGFSGACIDGFTFDGSDRSIYMSADVATTVYHYQPDGTLIETLSTSGRLGGFGSSGMAAGGGKLYLANNGGQQIYVAPKDLSSSALFASFPRRIEDLECDDRTFAEDGIAVIWQQDAFDRQIQAFAIEPGACPFGGAEVPQVVVDVQPDRISLASSPTVNVILLSRAGFDATAIDLSNTFFVVDGDEASGAPVMQRRGSYVTSTADWNHDSLTDRMVVFRMSDLVAAGLTAGTTDVAVQDVTSASGKFQGFDTVLPIFLP